MIYPMVILLILIGIAQCTLGTKLDKMNDYMQSILDKE